MALNGLKIADAMDVENPGASFADLRPFDKNDWQGFAGAENFDDGTEPMIGEVKVTGWPEEHYDGGKALDEAVIIVDGRGTSINGMNGAIVKNHDVFGKTKEQLIQEAKQLMAKQPIDFDVLLDMGWDPINMPNESFEQPQVPIEASTEKASGKTHQLHHSLSTPIPGNVRPGKWNQICPWCDAKQERYANKCTECGKSLAGAMEVEASDEKTAGPMNVENPEQAFQDNPDKYAVHVASQALESLVGGKIKYTDHKAAEAALAKLLKAGGFAVTSFTQLGYDDVTVEVADQATAKKMTDYLNSKLPKSTEQGGYGYGTDMPAQAAGYTQHTDQQEGDEYTAPNNWVYPASTL